MRRILAAGICLLVFLPDIAGAQEDELSRALARAQEIGRILDAAEPEIVKVFAPVEARILEEFKQRRAALQAELKRTYAADNSPKGEFETTAEYEARLRAYEQNKVRFDAEWARVAKELDIELSRRFETGHAEVEISFGYDKLRAEFAQIESRDYTVATFGHF